MKQPYLEVTFRQGRPLAAYYYLPRRARQKYWRSREEGAGLVVDYARNGEPLGIELTDPAHVTRGAINRLLRRLGFPPLSARDLRPLRAA
jgi:hypothetical protein